MNLPQARALVKLLEENGGPAPEMAYATVHRPGDINSTSNEVTVLGVTVQGGQGRSLGTWEIREDGETAPLD